MQKYIISILLIMLSIWATYIFTPRPYQAHHHANFAVYIDGKKWDFAPSNYMEEVSRCNITEWVLPADRIHLHDGKGWLVHVHMAASTWGDLLTNIGWGIWSDYLSTGYDQMYQADGVKHLYSIINGKIVMNPANMPVSSTDRLLVWYGTGTQEEILSKWDTLVDRDAHEYNEKADPASCSNNTYGWLSPIADPIMEWLEHHNN
jgi:hypothetical protein